MRIANVLTIAGSDPSGGAGLQADIKTFTALGCYGMSVVTALTVQNTQGIRDILHIDADFVTAQLDAIFDDIDVDAIKIGMVGNARTISALADFLTRSRPRIVVIDPVMVSTSGDSMLSDYAIDVMKEKLIPLCDAITPNIPEAENLLGKKIGNMEKAAKEIAGFGCNNVFLKGGHRQEEPKASDVLLCDGKTHIFSAKWVNTDNNHGTGCTLSAAFTGFLALGYSMPEAAERAKFYVTEALRRAYELRVGNSYNKHGPINHICAKEVFGSE